MATRTRSTKPAPKDVDAVAADIATTAVALDAALTPEQPTPEQPAPEQPAEQAIEAAPAATTAPLEPPPAQQEAEQPPVIEPPAAYRTSSPVYDDDTREQVTDVEGLFVPVVDGGTTFRCTRRLLREVKLGARSTTRVLLVPKGQVLAASEVAALTAMITGA